MARIKKYIMGEFIHQDRILPRVPHNLIASPSLVDNYRSNLIQKKIISSNPVPIYISEIDNISEDPVTKVVEAKHEWELKLLYFKLHHQRVSKRKKLKVTDKSLDETSAIPKYVADFCNELENDPDNYFNGTYNWYHTNGSLNYFELGSGLLHVSGPKQNILNISKIDFNTNPDCDTLVKFRRGNNIEFHDTIFETLIHNELVFVRQKYQLDIKKLEIGSLSIKDIYTNEFSAPLVHYCLNSSDNKYFTVDVNRKMKIWDLKSQKCLKTVKLDGNDIDNWSHLVSIDNNAYHLDRKYVSIIDPRNSAINTKIEFLKDYNLPCDYQSVACLSQLSNRYLYIGTYHSILMVDFRNTKNIVKKWTHMMHSVPFVIRTTLKDKRELLCTSSQFSKDKMAILNSIQPEITAIPIKLKSLDSTLRKNQLQGRCLHPQSACQRLKYTTTGLIVVNRNQTCVLTQSSFGDIFLQKLSSKPIEDDEISCYEDETKLEKLLVPNRLKCTHIQPMIHLSQLKKQIVKTHTKLYNEKWKREFKELQQYQDLLAPNVLEAWKNIIDTGDNSFDMVSNWLADFSSPVNDDISVPQSTVNKKTMADNRTEQTVIEVTSNSTRQLESMRNMPLQTPKSAKTMKRKRISGF